MSDELTLPRGWSRFAIDDIADSIQYGHTASATDDPNGPRFLRITDIQDGRVDWQAVPSCDIDPADTPKFALRAGDLVFARTGATTGKSFLIRGCPLAVFASYLIRLRMREGVDPDYVSYFFQSLSYWRQIEAGKRGIGQPNVNATILGRVTMPVASLPEQRRIVAKIEELFSDLDAGVAALERVRANLKRYRAAVLKAAVEGRLTEEWRKQHPATEPAAKLLERILAERRVKWEQDQLRKFKEAGKTPPKGWKERYKSPVDHEEIDLPSLPPEWTWTTLGTFAWQVRDGPHHTPKYSATGVPFITGGHIRSDAIDFDRAKYISHELHAELCKRCKPEVGDLLYTKGGTTGIAHINRDAREFNVWVHVAVLKLVDAVDKRFLQTALGSPICYSQSQKYTHGVGNQDLGLTRMVKIAVPLPPLAEQAEIVAEVDRRLSVADAAKQQVEHALQRAARLRQAILKRAFEGKLVPQDPTDEPAATMLERAKAPTNGHLAAIETSGTQRRDTLNRRSRARA